MAASSGMPALPQPTISGNSQPQVIDPAMSAIGYLLTGRRRWGTES